MRYAIERTFGKGKQGEGGNQLSELRSAIGVWQSEILAELPDAVIEEDFADLHRVSELVESERLRRLAELERRGVHERDGHVSVVSWLASRFKVAWGAARDSVRVARSLEHMPVVRRALEDGELSLSAVRALAQAREVEPEAFARSESTLVEAAGVHSVGDLHRVLATGGCLPSPSVGATPRRGPTSDGACTPCGPSSAWSEATSSSNRTVGRRCSRPFRPWSMLMPVQGQTTTARRPSAVPTRW